MALPVCHVVKRPRPSRNKKREPYKRNGFLFLLLLGLGLGLLRLLGLLLGLGLRLKLLWLLLLLLALRLLWFRTPMQWMTPTMCPPASTNEQEGKVVDGRTAKVVRRHTCNHMHGKKGKQ